MGLLAPDGKAVWFRSASATADAGERGKHKERRAITFEEHQQIIERERNPEIRAHYQFLWHLGGSQTDIAELTAEDIDWKDQAISYQRRKTSVPVIITFGAEAASLLQTLPRS